MLLALFSAKERGRSVHEELDVALETLDQEEKFLTKKKREMKTRREKGETGKDKVE